jgi:hypothetical protein
VTDFSRGPALKYLKNFMQERPFCAQGGQLRFVLLVIWKGSSLPAITLCQTQREKKRTNKQMKAARLARWRVFDAEGFLVPATGTAKIATMHHETRTHERMR